jgi:probable FeS assembly SUF system protein SufT
MAFGFASEPVTLKRDCEAIEIPNGNRTVIPAGSLVRIMQSLGTSYTVSTERGSMYRVDANDSEALGLSPLPGPQNQAAGQDQQVFSEKLVWDQLKTVYDPEIPVNIVDLGLVYSCEITSAEQGGRKIGIKMAMTAPGCGMGNVLKADVEAKLSRLPEVKEVHVEVVFDPPWNPGRMSEAAKLQLGFDADYGTQDSAFPVYK